MVAYLDEELLLNASDISVPGEREIKCGLCEMREGSEQHHQTTNSGSARTGLMAAPTDVPPSRIGICTTTTVRSSTLRKKSRPGRASRHATSGCVARMNDMVAMTGLIADVSMNLLRNLANAKRRLALGLDDFSDVNETCAVFRRSFVKNERMDNIVSESAPHSKNRCGGWCLSVDSTSHPPSFLPSLRLSIGIPRSEVHTSSGSKICHL